MDQHSSEHGGHGEHGAVHLPDPSVWPLVAGGMSLIFGLALIYWTRDRDSAVAGLTLGAAALALLSVSFGWAYEDGRMKKKAELGHSTSSGNPRFTQVVTFSVAEGRLDNAGQSGVISAIEGAAVGLRDLAGFQDLRIIAGPATSGPSQVIVETTWANREGLATYEESRKTLLDIIAAHPDDVAAGSVQAFDMDVVRDTKDVSFRFGLGAAAAVLGSLVIGGFMDGAGLTLFESDHEAAAAAPPASEAPAGLKVTATDNKFAPTSLDVPPNADVSVVFENTGKTKHNLHFLDKKDGKTLVDGAEGAILDGGKSETLTFKTPAVGAYFYQCDLHPGEMEGTLNVKEGAAAPAAGAPGGAAGGATISAKNLKFDKSTIEAKAGQPFSITFNNADQAKHNISFYDKKDGKLLADGAEGGIIDGGKSETVSFTAPAAGKYYFHCDLHPDMSGTFEVS